MTIDVVVIGAGIFGSLITRALRTSGHRVLAVDDKRPENGSKPAACLLKPSWFSALGKDVYQPALKKLDELVGIQDIQFKTTVGSVTVHWCDPRRVMLDQNEVRTDSVSAVYPLEKGFGWRVWLAKSGPTEVRNVIVAAGIWTKLLFPEVDVVGQAGVAWLWPYGQIVAPKIKVWAPYKQIVAFNRGDGLWVGDGLSVRNWSKKYDDASLARCRKAIHLDKFKIDEQPTRLFGYRPYVKDAKPCFFKQVRPGLWVATGGAKNGTLAAGWCADQIVRALS